MGKITIMPKSIDQANNSKCDAVILGIKGLSINMPTYYEVEDISKIKNKEIFISLNKNMHNDDLDYLESVLLKLKDYPIKGVLFYDLAIPSLKEKLALPYDLVWNQEHMVNNYYTINFWYDMNVKYSYVSSDITLDEMLEIKANTEAKLMVTVFGYLPIFASRRHLIDNYLQTFDLKTGTSYKMEKEEKEYSIIDNENGTIVYTNFILEGLKEMIELDYDYVVLNCYGVDDEVFMKVLDIYNSVNQDNIKALTDELYKLPLNLTKGFFYEETVYKVK